jgi:hypothetical protein
MRGSMVSDVTLIRVIARHSAKITPARSEPTAYCEQWTYRQPAPGREPAKRGRLARQGGFQFSLFAAHHISALPEPNPS